MNGAPELDGAALVGLTTQLGGAPTPQLRLTELLYPFAAVRLPLNIAVEFTATVSDGFAIFRL